MNTVDLRIHINPYDIPPNLLEDFNPAVDGGVTSDTTKVNVNKTSTGYSVVYNSDVFNKLDKALFMANIVKIFNTNLPGSVIDIGAYYNFETNETYEFDEEVYDNIIALMEFIEKLEQSGKVNNISSYQSESMEKAYEFYMEHIYDDSENDDPEDEEDDETETEFDNIPDDPFGIMSALYGKESNLPRKKKKSKNKKKEYYGRSRVWKNAKNAKRSYKRHGIIIADDKDDIKKDEKIIKSFLKDFMPGNASWEKDFREDVQKRFINMYTVTKKNLKKLEKQHRKYRSSRRSSVDAEKAIDFTRRLLNVPIDCWNDPTK